MAEAHYTGGCHCGAVRYEADADLDGAMTCNCSRCQKLGWTIAFTTAEKFTLLSGDDSLTDYRFNKRTIHHLFCSTCGIESFARGVTPKTGRDVVVVNVRCLDGVEPGELSPKMVDGRSF